MILFGKGFGENAFQRESCGARQEKFRVVLLNEVSCDRRKILHELDLVQEYVGLSREVDAQELDRRFYSFVIVFFEILSVQGVFEIDEDPVFFVEPVVEMIEETCLSGPPHPRDDHSFRCTEADVDDSWYQPWPKHNPSFRGVPIF